MKWDIQPEAVRGILRQTGDTCAEFDTQFRELNSAIDGAKAQAPGPIADALAGFAEAKGGDVTWLGVQTDRAINGCAQAVQAYEQGDLEMAANAQEGAASATDPRGTMPGYGGAGGGGGGL